MLAEYLPILIFLAVAGALGLLLLVFAGLLFREALSLLGLFR